LKFTNIQGERLAARISFDEGCRKLAPVVVKSSLTSDFTDARRCESAHDDAHIVLHT
jgi:hypothetical protein